MCRRALILLIFSLFVKIGTAQEVYKQRTVELVNQMYSTNFKTETNTTHFRNFTPNKSPDQKISILVNNGKIIDSTQASKFYFSENNQELFVDGNNVKKIINTESSFGSKDYCMFSNDIIKLNKKYIKLQNRQFLSPFSEINQAKYSFEKDNLYVGKGVRVNITPTTKHSFTFHGSLLFSDSLTYLKEMNLYLGNSKIQYVDSFSISLSYRLEGNKNVLSSQVINYWGNFYDYQSVGSQTTFFENYKFDDFTFPAKRPNEVVLIEKTNSNVDFSTGNMLCCLDTSGATNVDAKTYSDKSNFISDLSFNGMYFIEKNRKNTYYFSPIVYLPQFDAYQGWSLDQQIIYKHFFANNKSIEALSNIRYNMSFNKLLGRTHLTFLLSPKKQFKLLLDAGSYVQQISQKDPFNLTSWLLYIPESDLSSKVHSYDYVKGGFDAELSNGLYIRPTFEYSERASINKTRDYPYAYNPLNKQYSENFGILAHRHAQLSVELKYNFAQKYFFVDNKKTIIKSYNPTFKVEYHKGIRGIGNSVTDFNKIGFSIQQNLHTGSFGLFKYKAQVQKFLSFKSGTLIDLHHLQSSRIILYDSNPIDNVFLLEYYELDNSDYFVQVDIVNDYNSIITSKIPILKKFKCSLTSEFHQIFSPTAQYSEVVIGLNRLFNKFKISYALGVLNGRTHTDISIDGQKNVSGQLRHGIRIGVLLEKQDRL